MAIKITAAKPKDAYVLSVLTREYFDYAKLDAAKILARLKSPDYEYWIARDEIEKNKATVSGFIDVDFAPIQGFRKETAPAQQAEPKKKPEGPRKATHAPLQAKILGLAVLPEFRGKGIAKRLVAKATARAKARGCREIFLLVREDNEAAQKLYACLGFVLRGALAEKMWGQRILLFAKQL